MDDQTRIADALMRIAGNHLVTWRQALITGVALVALVFTGLAFLLDSHAAQPHADTVRQIEFDRTLKTIAADLGEIRSDIRELRKGG